MEVVVQRFGSGLRYLILLIWLLAVLYPMIWLFYTSAKSTQEVYQNPFGLPRLVTSPRKENTEALVTNYRKAWVGSHFSRYFVNSLKIVGISLVLILLLGSMAAYALARFDFVGR